MIIPVLVLGMDAALLNVGVFSTLAPLWYYMHKERSDETDPEVIAGKKAQEKEMEKEFKKKYCGVSDGVYETFSVNRY